MTTIEKLVRDKHSSLVRKFLDCSAQHLKPLSFIAILLHKIYKKKHKELNILPIDIEHNPYRNQYRKVSFMPKNDDLKYRTILKQVAIFSTHYLSSLLTNRANALLRVLVPYQPFQPGLLLESKARAYPSEHPSGASALPTNNRLGWKKLAGTNTLAYLAQPLVTKRDEYGPRITFQKLAAF